MIPFITCDISLGQHVCELVFGVNVFDLDLEVQNDSIKQPIKSNSVSCRNMSHRWTSAFHYHLDHCFDVFKHIQHSFLMRRLDVWGNKINIIQIINHSLRLFSFCESCAVENKLHVCSSTGLPVQNGSDSCFQELQRSDPINQEREYRPTSILHQKWFLILCETEVCFLHIQLIGTNVWLPKTHNVPPEVELLSPQDLPQNRSLETVTACIV